MFRAVSFFMRHARSRPESDLPGFTAPPPPPPDPLRFERRHWSAGVVRVAGIDEAGRGPLAGPVIAACVLLPRTRAAAWLEGPLAGLTDSKQLTAVRRDHYFEVLHQLDGVEIGVGEATAPEIDALNILRATHLAMRRAADALPRPPDIALVDGLPVKGLSCPHEAIVHGDALSLSISAASVIAKVTRDRFMIRADARHPGYGFAGHKGYGTRRHLEALARLGPCAIHRRSFEPVRQAAADGDAS